VQFGQLSARRGWASVAGLAAGIDEKRPFPKGVWGRREVAGV
jgi:hypothetical protein